MRWIHFLSLLVVFCFALPGVSEVDGLSQRDLEIQEKAEKRLYPGGLDEEDLEVLERATEASIKVSRRTVEKEVYKTLFNEDLKDSVEDVENGQDGEPEAEDSGE